MGKREASTSASATLTSKSESTSTSTSTPASASTTTSTFTLNQQHQARGRRTRLPRRGDQGTERGNGLENQTSGIWVHFVLIVLKSVLMFDISKHFVIDNL